MVKYKLSQHEPIASGGEKLVFVHPENDSLLIKVWRDRYFSELIKKYPLVYRYLRTPKYSGLLNEIVEHIAIRENGINASFLQEIYGLVDTDMGVGLVVEAIKTDDGGLAKTLQQIVEEGLFEQKHRKAVTALTTWLCETHVIVRDFTLSNVVWDAVGETFIIIDGIGSRPVPSLRMISRKYNNYTMTKKVNKFLRRLDSALAKAGNVQQ